MENAGLIEINVPFHVCLVYKYQSSNCKPLSIFVLCKKSGVGSILRSLSKMCSSLNLQQRLRTFVMFLGSIFSILILLDLVNLLKYKVREVKEVIEKYPGHVQYFLDTLRYR